MTLSRILMTKHSPFRYFKISPIQPFVGRSGPLKAQQRLGVGLGWRCAVAILECIQIYNLRVFPELNTWVKIIFKEKLNEILH